jgi:hypothetical protein
LKEKSKTASIFLLDDFEVRISKQQSIINDQQRLIETLKDEQNKSKLLHDQQCAILNEQSSREKNEIKEVRMIANFLDIKFVVLCLAI